MKFVIIGAGAVGGYFGAKLQLGGNDVEFLVTERRYSELEEKGLMIQSMEGAIELKVHAVRNVDAIKSCDVVMVAVKNFNLEDAIETVAHLANDGARVLTLMNGVDQFEKIRAKVTDAKIVGGVCYLWSTLDNGLIIQTGITPHIIFGSPSQEGMSYATEVARAFQSAKISTALSEQIVPELWRKFVFITSLSAVTCLARAHIGPIRANPYSLEALNLLVDEIVSVATTLEPELGKSIYDEILKQLRNLPESSTTSMARDLEKGRPLEVENLQGCLVRKARELGLQVPALTACYGFLKLREHGELAV